MLFRSQMNIGLAVFNLIPIPPLDGSKILAGILSEENYFKLMRYENYFMYLVFFLLQDDHSSLNVSRCCISFHIIRKKYLAGVFI